ncbi:MAG TPA: PadR family transcriptional regulator [Telmatospirillum sp.]|nr:PadR family transcriptional regulator [Telmatospirillum sp.]
MFHFRSHRHQNCNHDRRHVRGDFWPGGEHPHGFGRGGRRGGRLGRLFAHGDLHFIILHLIAEKPRHGYEIIKAIEEKVAGAYSPSPGTIYPALTMLEEQGYVTVEPGEGSKKLYAITDEGKAYLDINHAAVEALLMHMEQANAMQGGDPAPQIIRAVENLKLALRLRLTRGTLSEDQIRAVTEALDRAAGEIERS